jgi:acyl-CoA reductase-like NAD-dependent aldehyde dehydrogenase
MFEVAVPVGVIAGLIPSTNPTSTAIYKAMVALKAGNGIVFSPHPSAKGCILETIRVLSEAVCAAGGPEGIFGCMTIVTLEGTEELMHSKDVALILATAWSGDGPGGVPVRDSGYRVGSGNTPAFIERSADIPQAVRRIISSKTFDYSTISDSEQSVVAESCIEQVVRAEFEKQLAHTSSRPKTRRRWPAPIFTPSGGMNPRNGGKSPKFIAEKAGGGHIPGGTKLLHRGRMAWGRSTLLAREALPGARLLLRRTVGRSAASCA